MEFRPHAAPIMPGLVRWLNVKVFPVPHAMRYKYYVGVPDWWVSLEPPQVLLIPSAVVFAYYSGIVSRGLAHYRVVWLIAKGSWPCAPSCASCQRLVMGC